MKIFVLIAALLIALSACTEKNSPNPALSPGSTVENFTLPDTNGAQRSLNDLKGENGSVIVFVSTSCPINKQYNTRIAEFAADLGGRGIRVIGINSNYNEDVDEIRSHAADKYQFPVLIDKGNVLADKLGANVTPEIFYVNEKGVLVYHGAIDNDRSGSNITEQYLRDAVDANLGGRPVAKQSTNVIGCSIKRA